MKIAISAFAFLFLAAHVAASTQSIDDEKFNDAPVIIKASCSGVDFGSLSVEAEFLAGKALESSYNKVHAQSEHLSNVQFAGQVRDEENLAHDSDNVGQKRYYGWNGNWGCEGCREGDEVMVDSTGMPTKAWEVEFVVTLLSTNNEEFKDVKTCDLMILPRPDIVDEPNVDIMVKCTGGPDFEHLTMGQATEVSHALQSSYNDVHGDSNDGHLDNVIYHDKPKAAADDSANLGQKRYYGWNGNWGCEGCRVGNEVMASGMSDDSLKAWENKLVDTLTQNGNADFKKIKHCDIKMSPHHLEAPVAASTQSIDDEKFNDAPVIIKASCSGVDFGSLSVEAEFLAGKALESSYNKVHAQSEHLSNVQFAGQVRDEENLAHDSANVGQKRYYGWNGNWGCEGCREGDEVMVDSTGMPTTAWDIEFVVTLLSTNNEEFKDVKTCDLIILPRPDIVDEPNVDIMAKCTGGPDFEHLTMGQATMVSHALQSSYNDVHGDSNDGHLDNVIYHDKPKAADDSANLGQKRYYGWNGNWGCEGCRVGNEVMASGMSDDSLKAWENKLVDTLTQNGNADFKTIKHCDIKMSPHHLDGKDEEGDKEKIELSTGVPDNNVELSATCKGVDFAKLTLPDNKIVAHIFEVTYNRAHSGAGQAGSLSNVVFSGSRIAVEESVSQRRYWGWNSNWGCEDCRNVDVLLVVASGKLQHIWELEFTAELLATGHPAFESATDCNIQMKIKPAIDDIMGSATKKCGLRACVE